MIILYEFEHGGTIFLSFWHENDQNELKKWMLSHKFKTYFLSIIHVIYGFILIIRL